MEKEELIRETTLQTPGFVEGQEVKEVLKVLEHVVKTMVRQGAQLQPIVVHGGADIHL